MPGPKDPQKDPLNPVTSTAHSADPSPSPDPKANAGLSSHQDPQQPNAPSVNAPKSETVGPPDNNLPTQNLSDIDDPLSNNNPSSNDPSRSSTNSYNPSTKDPTNDYSSSNDTPGNDNDHIDNPSRNDLPANGQPTRVNSPISNDPSGNDSQSNNELPESNPSNHDPNSVVANTIPASPQTNSQPQSVQGQSPSFAAPNGASSTQTLGLGAQIANAFGYVPGSTAASATNVAIPLVSTIGAPEPGPQDIETVANGSATPLIVNGSPVQKAANGAIIIAGQTVAQGSQSIISGVAASVGSDNIVIDGTVHTFPPLAVQTPTPFLVGGYTGRRDPGGGLVVASPTITPGAQATVSGVMVSVGSNNAILDETTYSLVPMAPASLPVIIVNGIITLLQPGIDGAPKAPIISVAGQEFLISQNTPYTNAAGQVLSPGTADQGAPYIVAGQTLIPGGAAITVSGISISLPAGDNLATSPPAMVTAETAIQAGGPPPLTVGNQVFTPDPSAFVLAGTTISAGAPGVTVGGTLVSLLPSGSGLVVGSSTLSRIFSADATRSSSSGGANGTLFGGSSELSGVSAVGTSSSVLSSSSNVMGPAPVIQSAQTTGGGSSRASAERRQGFWIWGVVVGLIVGGVLM